MAGAIFGAVQLSLFVAGAESGEIWDGGRKREMLYYSEENAHGEREK